MANTLTMVYKTQHFTLTDLETPFAEWDSYCWDCQMPFTQFRSWKSVLNAGWYRRCKDCRTGKGWKAKGTWKGPPTSPE